MSTTATGKTRKNSGTLSRRNVMVDCRSCGKRTHSTVDGCQGLDLCRPCYEYAGWENAHSDYGHSTKPDAACPICQGQPDPATLTPATPNPSKEDTRMTDMSTGTTTNPNPSKEDTVNVSETTETIYPAGKAPKAPKAKAPKAKPINPTLGVSFENGGEVVRLNVADIALAVSENLTRPEGLDEAHVALLAEKIAASGQETPVWVRRDGSGKYRVAAGFHRRAAIGLLVEQGRSDGTIECKVLADSSALTAAVANVGENENGKRDITPLGRVAGYSALIEQGLTVAQVATLTGRAEDFVRDHLRLPKADPACAEALAAPEDSDTFVPWGVVRLVVRFPKGQQADALALVRGMSVAKATAALKALRDAAKEQPEEEQGEGEGEQPEQAAKADPLADFKVKVAAQFIPLFDCLMQTVREMDSALSVNDVERAEVLREAQRKALAIGQDALVALVGEDAYNAGQEAVDAKTAAIEAAEHGGEAALADDAQ